MECSSLIVKSFFTDNSLNDAFPALRVVSSIRTGRALLISGRFPSVYMHVLLCVYMSARDVKKDEGEGENEVQD